MNCEEFRASVLAGEENAAGVAHLESCASCRSQIGRLREMQSTLGDPLLWEEPSPELGDQIEVLIGSATRSEDETAPARPHWWWAIAAAVAAIVVAVGSLIVAGGPAPDWEIALPATGLAPNAAATVSGWNEEAGTRMLLDVDGLDPAPQGYMYEFWLSDGPVHISAGTFRSGGAVELWAGVHRADFPRLWVTLEPIDDDESPAAATVLDTGYSGA
jgi:hypothetical protein